MMQTLHPLTVSNSLSNQPTKLLTDAMDTYLLHQPFTMHTTIQVNLLHILFNHFRINHLNFASFSYKGKQYFCIEEQSNTMSFSAFNHYLWRNKKQFNQFLNPEEVIKVSLLNMLFPVFNKPVELLITSNRKFILHADISSFTFSENIVFQPIYILNSQLREPEIKKFLQYKKRSFLELIEAFEILHHDKLASECKYQISMHNDLRNAYWNALKPCFASNHKKAVFSAVKDHVLRC
jgi:hypothetical protein